MDETSDQGGPNRRRRRRTGATDTGAPNAAGRGGSEAAAPGDAAPARGRTDSDRQWRELTGDTPSQVGPSGALRARDVARPSESDLAEAERDVVIVRRGWKPPP